MTWDKVNKYATYMVLVKKDQLTKTYLVKYFLVVLGSDMLHYVICNLKNDMDIMRSQDNMMWIDMPHHHVTHFKLSFLVIDCKFFTTCYDKNTCLDLILIIIFLI